jgi:hypothetical protein
MVSGDGHELVGRIVVQHWLYRTVGKNKNGTAIAVPFNFIWLAYYASYHRNFIDGIRYNG